MKWNIKNIGAGILFIILALLCVVSLIQSKFTSYAFCGAIVFTIVAIAFFKRAKY